MVLKIRKVEIGRVAYIAYGDDKGKLCVIVDVIDQNRVLIDGPCTNVTRKQVNLKALQLTQFVLRIPRSGREKVVRKMWEKDNISKKWSETIWAKKIANREKRNRLINTEFGKLKKAAKKAVKKKTVR